jgi:hypothetical protein
MESTLQRVAANDPTLVAVDWYSAGADDAFASRLAAALAGNSYVRSLELSENPTITDASAQQLAAVLPVCAVEEVCMLGTGVGEALEEEIEVLCHAKHRAGAEALLREVVGDGAALLLPTAAGLLGDTVREVEDDIDTAVRRASTDDPSMLTVDWYHRPGVDDSALCSLAQALYGERTHNPQAPHREICSG